jgi:hypothetical protein
MKTWKLILLKAIVWVFIAIGVLAFVNNGFRSSILFGGLIAGIIGGLFAWLEVKWNKSLAAKMDASIPDLEITDNEKLIFKGGAGHVRGFESVGGKLFVTNKRLFFRSHSYNIQNHEHEFPLSEVKEVTEKNRELNVVLNNNEVHRFRVVSPTDWLQAIPRQKGN